MLAWVQEVLGEKEVDMRALSKGLAAVTLAAALSIPVGGRAMAAESGQPTGGGGCNMVLRGASGTSAGLDQMMAGAIKGNGQTNMFAMLDQFGC
jgi:hypothetical protein